MEPALTPEQNKQLGVWAGKRDAILKSISDKTVEEESLTKKVKALSDSSTELTTKIQQSEGRLIELDKKEKERGSLISVEVSDLTAKKSVLQTEVSNLDKDILERQDKKKVLDADIEKVAKLLESIFGRASEMEKVIGDTVAVNSQNSREIINVLTQAKEQLREVIEIGNKNVEQTNKVILELPKIVVDLHKDVIERRAKKPRQLPPKSQP